MIVPDEALVQKIELLEARAGRSSVAAYSEASGRADAVSIEIAGGIASFGGADSPMTQAIGVAIAHAASGADVDALDAFFRERGAKATIHVTPWTRPELIDALTERRYRIVEHNAVFARPLASSDTLCASTAEITLATGEHELDEAARVSATCFAPDAAAAEAMYASLRPLYAARGLRAYVARSDGGVIGAATLFVDTELKLAGLFGAATLPLHRDRGIHRALLERRLSDAYRSGAELALVTTLPGSASHRNVLRRGFELLYTKFVMRSR